MTVSSGEGKITKKSENGFGELRIFSVAEWLLTAFPASAGRSLYEMCAGMCNFAAVRCHAAHNLTDKNL